MSGHHPLLCLRPPRPCPSPCPSPASLGELQDVHRKTQREDSDAAATGRHPRRFSTRHVFQELLDDPPKWMRFGVFVPKQMSLLVQMFRNCVEAVCVSCQRNNDGDPCSDVTEDPSNRGDRAHLQTHPGIAAVSGESSCWAKSPGAIRVRSRGQWGPRGPWGRGGQHCPWVSGVPATVNTGQGKVKALCQGQELRSVGSMG